MTERTLDWRPAFDERSRAFRLTPTKRGRLRKASWKNGPVLDQGTEGACVGFAAAQNLQSTKHPMNLGDGNAVAREIYHLAQTIDEFPGENYDGTSVLAGMKAIKQQGYVNRYEWALSLSDVVWALSWRGPVQLGVWWYSDMWDTDATGFIHVSGNKVGGHSILASGVDPFAETVTLTNSWGPGWGRNGKALISFHDLEYLLNDGEAVSILKPVV